MKKLLFGFLAVLLASGAPGARADDIIKSLDAAIITYAGEVVRTTPATETATERTVTFKVNKTGEIITLKISLRTQGFVSELTVKGPSEDPFKNLTPGMRVLIKRYQGSKGAKYAKPEPTRPTDTNQEDFDDYVYQLTATSKPQPK